MSEQTEEPRPIDDGGPAFPKTKYVRVGSAEAAETEDGMSLRQWYAGHAPAPTEQWVKDSLGDGRCWIDGITDWNYFYADAMIAEGKKPR